MAVRSAGAGMAALRSLAREKGYGNEESGPTFPT